MKFEEAIKEAISGKKVSFNEMKMYIEDRYLVGEFKGEKIKLFSSTQMAQDIWKVVEDKDTLEDIKEEIRTYMGMLATSINKLKVFAIIDKRAGERLI